MMVALHEDDHGVVVFFPLARRPFLAHLDVLMLQLELIALAVNTDEGDIVPLVADLHDARRQVRQGVPRKARGSAVLAQHHHQMNCRNAPRSFLRSAAQKLGAILRLASLAFRDDGRRPRDSRGEVVRIFMMENDANLDAGVGAGVEVPS